MTPEPKTPKTPKRPRRPREGAPAPAPAPAPDRAPEPAAPTAAEILERARSIGREDDLFYHAHLARWPTRPSAWTAAQRANAEAFLAKFIRPDGTPQPVPHRGRRGR
jgi:hypothetical protein